MTTGVLRAVSEVGALGNLLTTSFGVSLLAKVGLFLALAQLGALNRYRSLPVLMNEDGAERRFQWTSRAELVVAVGILVSRAFSAGWRRRTSPLPPTLALLSRWWSRAPTTLRP